MGVKALVGKLAGDGTVEVDPWDRVYNTSWAYMLLSAMQKRETFYYGTVSYDERQKRRARNRVARKLRKANRRAGASR